MIRVLIVSPAVAVRVGLRALLQAEAGIEVIAEAASLSQLEDTPQDADVVVLASQFPARLDIEETLSTLQPDVALLSITDDMQAAKTLSGLPLRAWGVLPPEASQEELIAAVQALHQGLVVGDPAFIQALSTHSLFAEDSPEDALVETLTERESEVLQLLAQGLANKQIALRLGISAHTVKFHISSIYGKLGATNRTEAVRLGLQHGLVVL